MVGTQPVTSHVYMTNTHARTTSKGISVPHVCSVWDEVASSKLNLHGGFFRKYGHLGLFEAKDTCVTHRLAIDIIVILLFPV